MLKTIEYPGEMVVEEQRSVDLTNVVHVVNLARG